MIRLGINGFGRIGKLVCRMLLSDENFDLVQINDPMSTEAIAHLLNTTVYMGCMRRMLVMAIILLASMANK